ncbi:NUDIX domain-containing protein [Nocardioides sp. T2.26MG-1]|uniref:NUDIX domain-containing protein n=1 Tax=Nocardioides sp. T2.26MG-1 TaxID=3041166 RepID=UPI0024777320|nr:NUDIX domain-containing protein [Nocardioides sp. T2.26MG-1]CAI9414393.1 NADH pyrophosphatase [Nocardioides sp. T2.26MG-1]
MKKYILFAHDGVLVDTERWYLRAGERALAEVGLVLDEDQYLRDMSRGLGTWARARAAGIDEQTISRLREARDRYYQEHLRREAIEIDGAVDVLAELSTGRSQCQDSWVSDYIGWLRAQVGHDPVLLNFAVAVIRDDEGRLLLQQRGDRSGDAVWSFCGGAVELGESVEQGVVREVLEETGLKDPDPWFAADELPPMMNRQLEDIAMDVVAGRARIIR